MFELAYYTAVDAILLIRKGDDRSLAVLDAFALMGVSPAKVRDCTTTANDDGVERLNRLFMAASTNMERRLPTIRKRLFGPDADEAVMPDAIRDRMETTGIPIEIPLLLARCMDQAATVQARPATVTACETTPVGTADAVIEIDIRLPKGVTWTLRTGSPETVSVTQAIPETIPNALVERPLSALFQHALLGDRPPIIDRVESSGPFHVFTLKAA